VRFIYLDESGISKEATTVVAGVIVNADFQYKRIEKHVSDLVTKYVSEERRPGFIFHAKDLYHGTGRTLFDRRTFPLDRAREALKELLAIPSKFGLPVVYGYAKKEFLGLEAPTNGRRKQRQRAIREFISLNISLPYTLCAIAAERYMRRPPYEAEIATLIVENNEQTSKEIAAMHSLLSRASADRRISAYWSKVLKVEEGFLPVRKIIHSVHFQNKNEAFLLQIADACAFIIRCFIEKRPNLDDLIAAFGGNNQSRVDAWMEHRKHPGGQAIIDFGSRVA